MTRRLGLVAGMVAALLLAALGVYLYARATPYQEEVDHGPSPEAAANPYLAAEDFLRTQGLSVSHANGLDVLPTLEPRQHSLLLLGDRSSMTPRQIDQVLNWTRAGGRLLFIAESIWDEKTGQSNDLLLYRADTPRELVAEPGNIIYPESFVERCRPLADLGIEVSVLDEADMANLGMGALLGVAEQLLALPFGGAARLVDGRLRLGAHVGR